jgi:hypothetical protein
MDDRVHNCQPLGNRRIIQLTLDNSFAKQDSWFVFVNVHCRLVETYHHCVHEVA